MDEQTGPEPFMLFVSRPFPCRQARWSGSLVPLRDEPFHNGKSVGDPICGITMAFDPRVVKQVRFSGGELAAFGALAERMLRP
jgi:hypothetical protein